MQSLETVLAEKEQAVACQTIKITALVVAHDRLLTGGVATVEEVEKAAEALDEAEEELRRLRGYNGEAL